MEEKSYFSLIGVFRVSFLELKKTFEFRNWKRKKLLEGELLREDHFPDSSFKNPELYPLLYIISIVAVFYLAGALTSIMLRISRRSRPLSIFVELCRLEQAFDNSRKEVHSNRRSSSNRATLSHAKVLKCNALMY